MKAVELESPQNFYLTIMNKYTMKQIRTANKNTTDTRKMTHQEKRSHFRKVDQRRMERLKLRGEKIKQKKCERMGIEYKKEEKIEEKAPKKIPVIVSSLMQFLEITDITIDAELAFHTWTQICIDVFPQPIAKKYAMRFNTPGFGNVKVGEFSRFQTIRQKLSYKFDDYQTQIYQTVAEKEAKLQVEKETKLQVEKEAKLQAEKDVESDSESDSDSDDDALFAWAKVPVLSTRKIQTSKTVKPKTVKPKMHVKTRGKVDVTHLFFKSQREQHEEVKKKVAILKEEKKQENVRRTAVLQMMQDRQSEDRKVKQLANKPLRFTRRCRGAFNFTTGKWKQHSNCRHRHCKFAHSQKQLEHGIRGCICSFDGGRGKCRKPHTCTFIHTVDNGDGLRRVETDDEYYQRTGYRIGEYRDPKNPRARKKEKAKAEKTVKSQKRVVKMVKPSHHTFASITARNPVVKKMPLDKAQAVIRGYLTRLRVRDELNAYKREMFYRRQAEKHAQLYRSTITATQHKQVVVNTAPIDVKTEPVVMTKNIEYYLIEFRLDASVKGKLFDYGVGVLADLDDMEIEDVDDLELKPMEKKRFIKLLTYVKPLL